MEVVTYLARDMVSILYLTAQSVTLLTRLTPTGARDRTNTRAPKIFLPPLDAYARRAEKTIHVH